LAKRPPRTRVLFVDDEPSIRTTLPMILERSGFDVVAVGSVKEAIKAMSAQNFDVLLTDLNIGQPGDGFTVVSAMRRTQPEVVTVILTGYPAFETALAAIRSQVDDYLVKPADPAELVATLQRKITTHPATHTITSKRIPLLIEEHESEIVERWYACLMEDPRLAALPVSRHDRVNYLPTILRAIVQATLRGERELPADVLDTAAAHACERRAQGYTADLLIREWRYLRRTIEVFIQENLLAVEISFMVSDMILIGDAVELLLETSIKSYLQCEAAA